MGGDARCREVALAVRARRRHRRTLRAAVRSMDHGQPHRVHVRPRGPPPVGRAVGPALPRRHRRAARLVGRAAHHRHRVRGRLAGRRRSRRSCARSRGRGHEIGLHNWPTPSSPARRPTASARASAGARRCSRTSSAPTVVGFRAPDRLARARHRLGGRRPRSTRATATRRASCPAATRSTASRARPTRPVHLRQRPRRVPGADGRHRPGPAPRTSAAPTCASSPARRCACCARSSHRPTARSSTATPTTSTPTSRSGGSTTSARCRPLLWIGRRGLRAKLDRLVAARHHPAAARAPRRCVDRSRSSTPSRPAPSPPARPPDPARDAQRPVAAQRGGRRVVPGRRGRARTPALSRPTWENAWGKLPSIRLSSTPHSSASSPTSLRSAEQPLEQRLGVVAAADQQRSCRPARTW